MTDLPKLSEPINKASTGFGQLWKPLFNEDQMLDLQRATLEWAAQRALSFVDPEWPGDDMSTQCEAIAQAIREGLKADHL